MCTLTDASCPREQSPTKRSKQGVVYIPGSHITQGVQRLIGSFGTWPDPSAYGRNLQGV